MEAEVSWEKEKDGVRVRPVSQERRAALKTLGRPARNPTGRPKGLEKSERKRKKSSEMEVEVEGGQKSLREDG